MFTWFWLRIKRCRFWDMEYWLFDIVHEKCELEKGSL